MSPTAWVSALSFCGGTIHLRAAGLPVEGQGSSVQSSSTAIASELTMGLDYSTMRCPLECTTGLLGLVIGSAAAGSQEPRERKKALPSPRLPDSPWSWDPSPGAACTDGEAEGISRRTGVGFLLVLVCHLAAELISSQAVPCCRRRPWRSGR